MSSADDARPTTRRRILDAALSLAQEGGPAAVTTRAVASAAQVQPPTIYRTFGDKQGLLDSVVEHGIAAYVAAKAARSPDPDPVEEVRQRWDDHVAFGLANPALFSIMAANPHSPASAEGLRLFRGLIHAVAEAGRLATSEERALGMVRAACNGLVLMLIAEGGAQDRALSTATREAVLAAVTTEAAAVAPAMRQTAATLRAQLGETSVLSKGEAALLEELLARLSAS